MVQPPSTPGLQSPTTTPASVASTSSTSTMVAVSTTTSAVTSSIVTTSAVTTAAPTMTYVWVAPVNCGSSYSGYSQCIWGTDGLPTPVFITTSTVSSDVSGQVVPVSTFTSNVVIALQNTSASSSPTSSTISPSATGSTPTQSQTAKPTNGGSPTFGTAAIAGAAVGCFVAGLLIMGLLAFLIFKRRARRNRYSPRSTYIPATAPAYGGEKGTPMVSIAPLGGFDFLPQQADDADIHRKLSTIIDQIDQHVENFYGNRGVLLDAPLEGELSRFETSQLPQPIAACFEYASNPSVLIKHCLAFHIVNLTLAPGEGTQPLLPPALAGTVAAVYQATLLPDTPKDTVSAFSTWKSLTKYLQPDLGPGSAASRATTESSTRIASHFSHVFSPWANPQFSNEQRSRHLTELIANAVQTAVWLFGQPDLFKFDWSSPTQDVRTSGGSNAVIVPAVTKITHNGSRLPRGQRVLEPVVRRY